MVQDLRRAVLERTTVDECAGHSFFISRIHLELDQAFVEHDELRVLAMHAHTAENDVRRRHLAFATDGDRERCHAVVHLLRQLRILIKVCQVRRPLVFSFLFFNHFCVLLHIQLLLFLQFVVEILHIFHLFLLMIHHVEEVLGVDLSISTGGLAQKFLELLVLCLQFSDQFILRTLINHSLVLDLFGSVSVPER